MVRMQATITLRVLTDDESPGAALVKYADTIKVRKRLQVVLTIS